jgi:hypothetical protein
MEDVEQLKSELNKYKRKCSELESELEYAWQGIDFWKSRYLDSNPKTNIDSNPGPTPKTEPTPKTASVTNEAVIDMKRSANAINQFEDDEKKFELCEELFERMRIQKIALELYNSKLNS